MFSALCNRVIRSRNYTNASRSKARVVVIHTMESPESATTAEAVASWFAGSSAPQASAHYCVDNNTIVGCVDETDVAWAAPGCNHDGIQIELAGRAGQSAKQWADAYSKAELVKAARLVADICKRHGIPARHLSNSELAAGKSGIIGHVQASQVYKKSTHTDPGAGFPWSKFVRDIKGIGAPSPRYRYVLKDKHGKVITMSSITTKAGLAHRLVLFATRVAPVVARMKRQRRGPKITAIRVN